MMQNNIFKARCSAISPILVEPKTKSEVLSVGCITYVETWLKEQRWNRKKSVDSKYTIKGNLLEDEAIDLIIQHLDTGLIKKNTERKTNNFLLGECDIDVEREDLIIDIKNSWSLDTFPIYADKCQNVDYERQINGYMELWGRSNGAICYMLMDCPTFMIRDAIQREYYVQFKQDPDLLDLSYNDKQNIIFNMVFTNSAYREVCSELRIDRSPDFIEIPDENRIKTFRFTKDTELIERIKDRVNIINDYLASNDKYSNDFQFLTNKYSK